MKKNKIYILFGVCGILTTVSIFLTIGSASDGTEIASLQNKESQLMTEQQHLQENLVENLSISNLQEKSIELGFVKSSNLVYVRNSDNVASVARIP